MPVTLTTLSRPDFGQASTQPLGSVPTCISNVSKGGRRWLHLYILSHSLDLDYQSGPILTEVGRGRSGEKKKKITMSTISVDTSVDFPDRGPAVFAVVTATLSLATVFVAARLVSRIGIVRSVSWDDYIIVLAWLIAFFLGLTINFGTKRGLGRHDTNINHVDRPGLRMCEYVFSILYVRSSVNCHRETGLTSVRTRRSCPPRRQSSSFTYG